jgi:hypothetical protein
VTTSSPHSPKSIEAGIMLKHKLGIVVVFMAAAIFCAEPQSSTRNLTPKYPDLHCDSDDDCSPGTQCESPNNTLPHHCYAIFGANVAIVHAGGPPGPFKNECNTDQDCDPPFTCQGAPKNSDGSPAGKGGCVYYPHPCPPSGNCGEKQTCVAPYNICQAVVK